MTLEEALPALRNKKSITRRSLDGKLQLILCKDNKMRLRIWRGCKLNYPYTLDATDVLANDWEIV